MMVMINMKLYFLFLLGFYIIINNNTFLCLNTTMKKVKQNEESTIDLNSLKNESDNDFQNLDEKSLDKLIKEEENDNLSKEQSEELLGSISTLSEGDLTKLNLDDLKNIEEDKSFDGQSCDDIKKLGQQKKYCEKKYLLLEGEEKTVECMKSFCSVCCNGSESCENKCTKTHAFFTEKDPEEMFIAVCSHKNMGPSFEGFCKSMISATDQNEYDQCITNFCFDCCSNELKVTDFNDPEMVKCLGICKPPKHDTIDKPVPGTMEAKKLEDKIEEEKKKKDVQNELNMNKELLDMMKSEENQDVHIDSLLDNKNTFEKILNNEQPYPNDINLPNVKVLYDFSKSKNSTALIENESKKNQSIKNRINEYDLTNEKIIETDNPDDQVESLSKLIDQVGHEEGQNKTSIITKTFKSTTQKKSGENINLKDSRVGDKHTIDSIQYTPEERKKENIKTCENLILSFNNIKHFGKNIYNHCNNNYVTNLFESVDDCLNSLCEECCNFLDSPKEITQCVSQCNLGENVKKNNSDREVHISNEDSFETQLRFRESKKNLVENKRFLQKDLKPYEAYKKVKGLIKNNNIFPKFNKREVNTDYNIQYFNLIKSLCTTKYFKDCFDIICNDYCNDSDNIINPSCLNRCQTHMNKQDNKNDVFDYILKRHGYYEAKFEILFQRTKSAKPNYSKKFSSSSTTGLNFKIDQSKDKIENLKKQLMEEEKVLLKLYKMKRD